MFFKQLIEKLMCNKIGNLKNGFSNSLLKTQNKTCFSFFYFWHAHAQQVLKLKNTEFISKLLFLPVLSFATQNELQKFSFIQCCCSTYQRILFCWNPGWAFISLYFFCKMIWHFEVQSNIEVYLSFASIYINPDKWVI